MQLTSDSRCLLQVRHLRAIFRTGTGVSPAVDDVSFSIARGETLGLVGESGCGKSITALSILGLVSPPGEICAGEILLDGKDLRTLSAGEMRRIRNREIAIIFQEPMSALNPLLRIGVQVAEGMEAHLGYTRRQAWKRGIELLGEMGISQPMACMNAYPWQLSGGMCQRVLIAMAVACRPRLLIADEPTTALDVTIQAQILDPLYRLRHQYQLSMLVISHDLGVIAEVADQVAVMYAGQIVEYGSANQIFYQASHSYTQKLLLSVPRFRAAFDQPALPTIEGSVPHITKLPAGCHFYPRCSEFEQKCAQSLPDLFSITEGHWVRCFRREHLRTSVHPSSSSESR